MRRASLWMAWILASPSVLVLADGPPYKSVVELRKAHDKALLRDVLDYLAKNPKAEDRDEGYTLLFDTAIEHDWFAETEAAARRYIADQPEGAARPLAQIVATMARAKAGKFGEALASYKELMRGITKPEQEEFAVNFSENLASAATTAGEFKIARQVYESLLDKFKESAELRTMVQDHLTRLERVGKRAPVVVATDVFGKEVRLSDLKGKYVLIDFWSTNIAPCLAELPNLQAAYAKYHDKGFEVIAVSLDENPDAVVDFVKARKLGWKHIHNATGGSDLVDAIGGSSLPASFRVHPPGGITPKSSGGGGSDCESHTWA